MPISMLKMVASPLQNLHLGPDEVLVRVHAVGLNFRDVLMALGMYQGKVEREADGTILVGGDASGEIVAVGENISTLSVVIVYMVGYLVVFGSYCILHLKTCKNSR